MVGAVAEKIVMTSPRLLPGESWLPNVDTNFSREGVDDLRRRWDSGDRCSVIAELTRMEFKDPEKHAAEIEWMVDESMKSDPHGALAGIDGIELDFRESLSRVDRAGAPPLRRVQQHDHGSESRVHEEHHSPREACRIPRQRPQSHD
jgi:hypothetical protein